ncbi:tRNA (adenosine(37)-N6)-dimethylallyltransferase MiaA [Vagococcus coleopterorum]|uniref:tRNA dimethylallyltransferase n=1 Tax=Vagococcus coleopterorum TaxID=2714946 RepID=A0A6G8APH6_9ENTE|nr:tRNA (adenosine(37)-N6)-dimethylallyltransferase MiaA [Vagococcus coleopterorum]QIL46906.1 tRNA (adenosine(37)-N6)-dimethylallyltransferase MiaA [Vagococcus coleopterorum]
MPSKEKVCVIVGPTAVGKTALSVELAKQYNGEIISGDSLQIYRGLDVGTAKATTEEQQGVPHHLLDICELGDSYSVADFKETARGLITEITARGKLPIVVGGTGLYIQALLFDFELGSAEGDVTNQALRDELEEYAETYGTMQLWERLRSQDQAAADLIHPNNVRRVIRAIEVIEQTGISMTAQPKVDFKDLSESCYDVKLIALESDRQALYDRINNRIESMLTNGLLAEAQQVYDFGPSQAAQGIGYKEFFPYFEGEQTLEEATEFAKQQSRRYAKRQLTWFRNRMTCEWWDLTQSPETMVDLSNDVATWLTN